MHTSRVSCSDLKLTRQQQNIAKKAETWLGREVYAAKNVTQIRWQGIAAGIILALGVILLPFLPPLAGAAMISLGVLLGIKTLYDASRENPLERALIEVIGNQQKLDRLPEFCLTVQNRHEMKNHPKRFVSHRVAENVMRVTRDRQTLADEQTPKDRQTHGLLFKYQVENANQVKRFVQIFLFREPFDALSSSFCVEDEGKIVSYAVDIRNSMKGREGRALIEMIHRGDFNRRVPLDQ